jgi:hypothetical protein
MIPNLVKLDQTTDNIWRGGEPTEPADWQKLVDLGITRVVKLNFEKTIGINPIVDVVLCEISLGQQLITRPSRFEFAKAVSAIRSGTYVHCEHGQDRTGLAIGAYRVWEQCWEKDAAYQEMLDHGYHPLLLGLTAFWHEFV